MWRSCVHELLKNGVAAMARELGEGRRQWRSALRLYSGAVRASEEGGCVTTILLLASA